MPKKKKKKKKNKEAVGLVGVGRRNMVVLISTLIKKECFKLGFWGKKNPSPTKT